MAEQIPDAWKGQEVTVYYGEEKNRSGVLDSLSERGVVLKRENETRFYPWTSITCIKHPASSGGAAVYLAESESFGDFPG